MLIPVRCFSCNKVIGSKYELYKTYLKDHSKEDALELLNLKRYCCKRMIISHIDDIPEKVIKYL